MIARQTPVERLAQSRERLRHALAGTSPAPDDGHPAAQEDVPWWHGLRVLPGAGVVIDGLTQWWARHPMRVPTLLAINAGQAVIKPLARQHPFTLVMAAFVVGGLVAWRRPWGWVLKPALFAGLLPQLMIASLKSSQAQSQSRQSQTQQARSRPTPLSRD